MHMHIMYICVQIWASRDVVMELPRVMQAAHLTCVEWPASQSVAEPQLVQANQACK